jgi:hypothetical protein
MLVLAAEYQTIAAAAQADRWQALLQRSSLDELQLQAISASDARGPLFAALRDAEGRGLNVEANLPALIRARSLAGADDIAAVVHHRVERWAETAARRRRAADNLIAGLIPRATGIDDAYMALGLVERDEAIERRAHCLAEQAIEHHEPWVRQVGPAPPNPQRRTAWMRTVTALGRPGEISSIEQLGQHKRATAAIEQALALAVGQQTANTAESLPRQHDAQPAPGVEL